MHSNLLFALTALACCLELAAASICSAEIENISQKVKKMVLTGGRKLRGYSKFLWFLEPNKN